MPRASRASAAAKARMRTILPMATTLFCVEFVSLLVRGTGARHRVKPWPVSALTGKFHRLDLPPESPVKQFVLFVGDSHLRALVDRYVRMPDGCLSFGFLSTPGASAAELRTELLNADIPRTPDIVCLLAPSNNLTATPGIEAAGVAFDGLLRCVIQNFCADQVFVLDFPPRLASELAPQQFLREEFRRVAAKNGVEYCVTADRFPLDSRALWSRDGIHLSDDLGMPLLAKLLWHFSFRQLQSPLPVTPPPVSPPKSPPTVRPFATTVVVKGEVSRPRPLDPFKETVVGRRGKVKCFVVLNPIRFSTDKLAAMDRIVPSNLDVPMGNRSKVICVILILTVGECIHINSPFNPI
uniref:Uncharacterized protein n=1 Tax=Gadus morhua TaxID=8049 RepID=A0A8C5AVQ0_GADMO